MAFGLSSVAWGDVLSEVQLGRGWVSRASFQIARYNKYVARHGFWETVRSQGYSSQAFSSEGRRGTARRPRVSCASEFWPLARRDIDQGLDGIVGVCHTLGRFMRLNRGVWRS